MKFKQHVQLWKDGCGSDQCDGARKKCFARGRIPAEILFIGQAPGESEDVLGFPFAGPAGHLLNRLIKEAGGEEPRCSVCRGELSQTPSGEVCEQGHGGCEGEPLKLCFTNIVLCMPRDEDGKESPPSKSQIKSCKPRLVEMIKMAKPKLVVSVGGIAETAVVKTLAESKIDVPVESILHPGAVLKSPPAGQGLMVQKIRVTLSGVFNRFHVEEE